MHSPDYNLTLVRAMLDEFETYLLSDELFWPLDRSSITIPNPPRLTPGGLVLALDELVVQKEELTASQQAERQRLLRQLGRIELKWPAALGRKAAREMHSRFNLWRAYILDLIERRDRADNYAYEVRQRVIFERIEEWAEREPEAEQTRQAIRPIDSTLRSFFEQGEFTWDRRLRPCYPKDRYWFLYGAPVLQDAW